MPSDFRPADCGAQSCHNTVLHVLNTLGTGGTERVLVQLLRAWDSGSFGIAPAARRGGSTRRHAVITLREAGPLAAELPESVACYAVGARGRSRYASLAVAKIVRRLRPTILHARGIGCWADALAAKVTRPGMRLVLGFHGTTTGKLRVKDRRLARVGARFGACFATVGYSGRTQLHQELGVPTDRIVVLPNGIDPAAFARQRVTRPRVRAEFGWIGEEFVIGSVASLTAVKRPDLLIEAFRLAAACRPQLRLLLVGEGPLRDALIAQAHAAGLTPKVLFAGFRADIPAVLSALDAYVCASDSECMSNSVLQALAAELPVIATDVGDNSRVIRHGLDGLIVPPGSAAAIGDAILRLSDCTSQATSPASLRPPQFPPPAERLQGSPLARAMAESARRRALEFTFDKTVRAYDEFYTRLASGTAASLSGGVASIVG